MGKGNGSTRASSSGAPRGMNTQTGHYESFVDEDTGERIEVFVQDRTPAQRTALAKNETEMDKVRNTLDANLNQMRDISSQRLDFRNELNGLESQRRELLSDQEDELSRLSGREQDARAQSYGRRLSSIDSKINRVQSKISSLDRRYESLSQKEDSLYKKLDTLKDRRDKILGK